MNILMYSNSLGGHTQTFIAQDVDYLSKKHNLLYVCNTILDAVTVCHDNIKVIESNPMSLLQRALCKFDIHLSYKNRHFRKHLNHVINKFKPDLIHCHFGIEALRLIDNLDNRSIPVVIQFHGFDASKMLSKKSYIKRLKEVLNRDKYYSIFVSNSLRKNLERHSINVQNGMILHCGINLKKFIRDKNKEHNDFIFLQVSSLVEKKGHEYTLQAFAKFLSKKKSKNFKLILTGEGQRKEALVDLTEKLNIKKFVEFVGFISHKEVKKLMQNADVFVHHSITAQDGDEEGIPTSLMEAMAMELPILSTYHAGISELVTDGINGYLINERDVDTYASRMTDIISWDKLKLNRTVVAEEFEIGKHIAKLEEFYVKLINNGEINSSE